MKTENILIISSSVRRGRNSHRVALWLKRYLTEKGYSGTEIADLKEYDFPLFEERLKYQKNPSIKEVEFAGRVKAADIVIIVTPEYNGSFPASLKNAIDLLTDEWQNKVVAFATISQGSFGGSRVITSLQFVLWKMGAITIPSIFMVPDVEDKFNEEGKPNDDASMTVKTEKFINSLFPLHK